VHYAAASAFLTFRDKVAGTPYALPGYDPLAASMSVLLLPLLPHCGPRALQARGCSPRTSPPRSVVFVSDLEPAFAQPGSGEAVRSVRLGLAEESDLSAAIDVLMDGFYKDALTLAAAEFSDEDDGAARAVRAVPCLTLSGGFF